MSVTMTKPAKNQETGKWEVEDSNGEVHEFGSRKEAKDFVDGGGVVPEPEPAAEVEEEEEAESEEVEEEVELDEESSASAQAVSLITGASRMLSVKIKNLHSDLGKNEIEILNHLENEGMAQKELAKHIGTASTNVGTSIFKLEDAGLVESKRSKTDRRSFDIFLTAEGRKVKSEVVGKREEAVASLFTNFEDSEVETLVTLLKKLF